MTQNRIAEALLRLHRIMVELRGPGGCPWDARQDNDSLKPYLIEETYEVLDALDRKDSAAICDELGDLLLQIVFHCQVFAERDLFDLADVAEAISDKLVRRHPHVFADVQESDLEVLNAQWDRIKQQENGLAASGTSALDGIPASLPALLRAEKILGRFMRRGLSPSFPDAASRLSDLLDRIENPHTPPEGGNAQKVLGEALLATVRAGLHMGFNAEDALRNTLSNLESRFRELEQSLRNQGLTLESISPEELERLWEEQPAQEGYFLSARAKTQPIHTPPPLFHTICGKGVQKGVNKRFPDTCFEHIPSLHIFYAINIVFNFQHVTKELLRELGFLNKA